MERRSDNLHLPAIAVSELESGASRLRRAGAIQKVQLIDAWLQSILDLYSDRVLPFDLKAALIAGRLDDVARAAGRHPGFPDVAIAAIAKAHGLTVLTRNLAHFEGLGVDALDPFL